LEQPRGPYDNAVLKNDNPENDLPEPSSGLSRLFYLLLVAGLLGYLVLAVDAGKLLAIVKAAIGLSFVVFVHELGHFAMAKWCDVHVEAFSIGFGPALPGCSFRRGETTYLIGALPLGGYVKMVGEGPDAEDAEDDPRSFRNKPVWQRMAIISAGVTMNVVLALVCFVFVYRTHGAERLPGVVWRIDPGSPAWKLGVRSGDVIKWIGNRGPYPYFDDLRPVVMNSRENEKINFVWGPPNAPDNKLHDTQIEPRRSEGDSRPVIGIAPPQEKLVLISSEVQKEREIPCLYASAAARSQPPFQFDDAIIGTTDPTDPARVSPLPPDPRSPNQPDYFVFEQRMKLLAGKPVIIQVRRPPKDQIVDIHVPQSYEYVVGTRMRMGKVIAIRDDSPADKAGVSPDDIIDRVEVTSGSNDIIRFVPSRPGPAKKGIIEKELDPVRLPSDLAQWAEALPKSARRDVRLTLLRPNPSTSDSHSERKEVTIHVGWDESWFSNDEEPMMPSSPVSIPQMGLAYRVETRIEDVAPRSPASRAIVQTPAAIVFHQGDVIRRAGTKISAEEGERIELREGDQIACRRNNAVRAVRFYNAGPKLSDKPWPDKRWINLRPDQWGWVPAQLEGRDVKELDLRLERDGQVLDVHLRAEEDPTWPVAMGGLLLMPDTRLQKADSFGMAVSMGISETLDFISQIYQNLQGIITGRVSPENFGGPLMIAKIAYDIAGHNFYQFLRLLGIISINLAVINFLPIPVLDGGHMVFLVYEKLRGKPAPRRVQEVVTYVGLAFIFCLMVAVIWLDIRRF
jgi:regulator of sigma E protease